ncbi:GDYXXLXY domain-containing protein [Phenylobacterium sp. J367]|uniref:GDYXXLXY domain-containing protein n=1 Tax=Phenylobacterium sp. J367 TaxID=2898435 RepID=UPI002150D65F|nr:GDYXXLXY domain-containing protein [Phenylobacterium sp. J367]MCR5879925.1 GDYXXLXY domain-containing protein [Phenylobacterium sp. J367]
MRFGAPIRILLAASVLATALIGLVVREAIARDRGAEVVLPINAYDPRSPLSGHYVSFQVSYPLTAGAACPPGSRDLATRWRWVLLRREGGYHRVLSVSDTRAAGTSGDVPVWGSATCLVGDGSPVRSGFLNVDVGVDRFHADQDEALAIERALRLSPGQDPTAFVVLSVDGRGKARLKGLIVNGRRTDLDWL